MSNDDFWPQSTWQTFNGNPTATPPTPGLLKTTMGPMEVAQQVFPTVVTGNDNPIPADFLDSITGVPTSGNMKRFATVQYPFTLTPLHISDPLLAMATSQVNLAGQSLAIAEDSLFFFGVDASYPNRIVLPNGPILRPQPPLPNYVVDQTNLAEGLVGLAGGHKTQAVKKLKKPPPEPAVIWGINIYSSILDCVSLFTAEGQGPPYAVILSPKAFADANSVYGDVLASPASMIQPVLMSGPFVQSAGIAKNTYGIREVGLVASLGGKSTTLYVGTSPVVEFNTYQNSVYSFDVRESIQFVNVDTRSLIKLEFE
jgi:hypothetical protein